MENNIEKMHLRSKEELVAYLTKLFKKINLKDELVVMTHQIGSWDGNTNYQKKMEGILKDGLDCFEYRTIDGTLIRIGTTSAPAECAEKTANYNYHGFSNVTGYPTVVLAMPRYVDVFGEKVEYATSDYTCFDTDDSYFKNQKLEKLIKGNIPNNSGVHNQYTQKCWADVLVDYSFDKRDTFLSFVKDENGGYDLYLSKAHWIVLKDDGYRSYKQELSEKIEKKGGNLDACLIQKYKDNLSYLNGCLDDYD